ncbi:unnamed protein product [Cuscuta epithymum]|uniref:Uncharacterized protein n=1 Tax=Cuscuta epithymum TaxID=186058 RepID=A0AAV0DP98_9ASTE|nr:unnamed protein product [Cuscuta epithymum]
MFGDIIFACVLDVAATASQIAGGVIQSKKVRNAVKDPSSSSDCSAGMDVIIFWTPLLVAGGCGLMAHIIACIYGRRIYRNRDESLPKKEKKIYAMLFALASWGFSRGTILAGGRGKSPHRRRAAAIGGDDGDGLDSRGCVALKVLKMSDSLRFYAIRINE